MCQAELRTLAAKATQEGWAGLFMRRSSLGVLSLQGSRER